MGRKFLCCLPLAVGAWLFTFLFLTWGTALSVIGWYAYAKHDDASFNLVLTRGRKVSLIVTTVCWSILPVACLFGIGAIISRSYRALSFYSSLLQFQWGASIGSGAYFIYTLYRKGGNGEFQHDCENRTKLSLDECRHAFNTLRAIVIAVYVVIWLIQLWGSVTINFYATEHKKQAEFSHLPLPGSVLPVNVNPYSMAPAPSLPLIGPAPAGRFSPDRSYGSDPRSSFVPGMAGASLPPPVGVDGAQSQYAFTTYNNARGTGEKA